jgi:transcriptional regulator with XRE-family HTH domain
MAPAFNLADLGRRVRAARHARGLTLEETVAGVDLTVSWLSKIENGVLQPSLDALVKLADTLGCGVDHLVAGLSARPRYTVARQAARPPDGNGAATRVAIGSLPNGGMHPEIVQLAGPSAQAHPDQFEGERFLLVLEGLVRVDYGAERFDLEAGDGMYLDASMPHSIQPAGAAARVLSVSCGPSRSGGSTSVRRRGAVSRHEAPRASAGAAARTRGPASGRT